jgi:preprotein translocase subunit SecG
MKIVSREDPDVYHYELGQSWGNVFLICHGPDEDNPLCQASMETDQFLGREEQYHPFPMFSCTMESLYPTKVSGKSCYSKDMETNIADGCGNVANVGECDRKCVGGLCGVYDPPVEGQGTTNVLYVYMAKYLTNGASRMALAIILPIVAAVFVACLIGLAIFIKKRHRTQEDSTSTKQGDEQQESSITTAPDD